MPLEKVLWIFANCGSKQAKRSLPEWAKKDPIARSFVDKLWYDCLSLAEKLAYDKAVDIEYRLKRDKAIEEERVADQIWMAKTERDLLLKETRQIREELKIWGADHPQQPEE
ncbi:uncharacterized protein PGTG_16801 [Puccinia graminis f. sp. tritici CRL 75-36-700-3]|uniref:Uncharacterized protein n=1 Tax=Puccinia graminis f. sp. tritici (strain CRL 75-36-700-3 / race SCCL) TaxID=418459 RepID=E3L2M4_PUCGT|nr:uncharacterized protein PGTG_16801 [Puccinia graminis f. sp. tritici CRL 75-36-700-3]EFP90775.2 hypothetical protein PGTG_16801 [Puccinia graminis f. sp. tritici CRL 75-36-700-3]